MTVDAGALPGDPMDKTVSIATTEVAQEPSEPGTFTRDMVKAIAAMEEIGAAAGEDASSMKAQPPAQIVVLHDT